MLNGTHDRETSGFSASCFVTAITDALNRKYGDTHNCLENSVSGLIELQFKIPHTQWCYGIVVIICYSDKYNFLEDNGSYKFMICSAVTHGIYNFDC